MVAFENLGRGQIKTKFFFFCSTNADIQYRTGWWVVKMCSTLKLSRMPRVSTFLGLQFQTHEECQSPHIKPWVIRVASWQCVICRRHSAETSHPDRSGAFKEAITASGKSNA